MSEPRPVRAPRGSKLTCKSWLTEAPFRMIQNNLDPEVAERPDDLVVYGGSGQAARNWESFDAILATLKELEADETLLVQSGKPVAVFQTHPDAPRVMIANSNLVPHWATQEHFDELAAKGLIMYGQMTAGSWIYIGTQGILQGTYETLGSLAHLKGWPSLKGKFVLTAGLGGMGGAQPLAITMNEGVGLIVEVDPERAKRRLDVGYVDTVVDNIEEAMTLVEEAVKNDIPKSIGLIGNAADIYPELVLRGVVPDVVTDQTPAHNLHNYIPAGLKLEEADALRQSDPERCWHSKKQAQKSLITATTSASVPLTMVSGMLSTSRGLFQHISALFSVKAKDHSAGWHFLAIQKTSIQPIVLSKNFFLTTPIYIAGWIWPVKKFLSRGCHPAFAGWAMVNVPWPASPSTNSWLMVSSLRRLLSVVTTLILVPSLRRIVRRRA